MLYGQELFSELPFSQYSCQSQNGENIPDGYDEAGYLGYARPLIDQDGQIAEGLRLGEEINDDEDRAERNSYDMIMEAEPLVPPDADMQEEQKSEGAGAAVPAEGPDATSSPSEIPRTHNHGNKNISLQQGNSCYLM